MHFPLAAIQRGWPLVCMHVCGCVCVLCVCRTQSERECVATLPETVSKSVVISEEFTVGCLPVVGAGGSY